MESNLSSQHSGQDSCTEGAGQPTRLLDQGGKSVLIAGVESCGAAARGWPTASAVGLGIENLSAKRRKKVLLDPTLSPLTGLFARAHGSPRLTPWATIFRHSVADISSCGCPKWQLCPSRRVLGHTVGELVFILHFLLQPIEIVLQLLHRFGVSLVRIDVVQFARV